MVEYRVDTFAQFSSMRTVAAITKFVAWYYADKPGLLMKCMDFLRANHELVEFHEKILLLNSVKKENEYCKGKEI